MGTATIQTDVLEETLERVYARYNHRRYIGADPLQFAYRYADPRDIEVAAFLAAALAYGRVQQIERSVNGLLSRMGPSPYEFVAGFDTSSRARLAGFKHRFTSGETLADLLELLRLVLYEHGSLEAFFVSRYDPAEPNIVPALVRFCDGLSSIHAQRCGREPGRELMYLFANPRRGSASKRLHLFLRWMVRADAVDVGLWTSIDKAKLVVPMDVHMGRLCHILGLYEGKTISLSTAVQVTESFARIEPADPVKYDFALCRIGILENCDGHCGTACEGCELLDMCSKREKWKR
jgi:uncharacterized protein (TIGR02757 family)